MKTLLKLEFFAVFIFAIVLFSFLTFAWWWFPILFFIPDISIIGYAINTRVGAICYNLVHTLTMGIFVYILSYFLHSSVGELVGVILIAHSAFDRVIGYGLKYPDSFKHTSLEKL